MPPLQEIKALIETECLNRNKGAIKKIARKNFIPEVLQIIFFMAGLPACSVFRDLPKYSQVIFPDSLSGQRVRKT